MQKQLAIFFITALFSQAMTASTDPFSGFYAGVGVGFENLQANDSVSLNGSVTGVLNQVSPYSVNLTDESVMGGIHVGYSKVMQHMFLGGLEARANILNLKTPFDTNYAAQPIGFTLDSDSSLKLNYDFSLLMKLGWVMQPNALIYGLIGPTWGHFKRSSDTNFSITNPVFFLASSENDSESDYQIGWSAGLGFEYLITPQMSLALEYLHSDYGTLDSIDLTTVLLDEPIGSLSMNDAFNAKTDTMSLRFSYYFDKMDSKKVFKH